MLTPNQISQYHSQGFVKGNPLLTHDQVEELCGEMARVIRDKDAGGRQPVRICNFSESAPVWQIVNIWEASDAFRKLVFNEILVDEIAQLTGANELRVWHDQIQYKPAGTGGANMWHQDHPYWPIIQPASQITAWIALDDADKSNGCMSMVPGSHLWGPQSKFLHGLKNFDAMPKCFEDHEIEVRLCPVRKGEVHFHHSLTWHGSNANTSGRSRRAFAIHYMTEETRYKAAGKHPMKKYVTVSEGRMLEGDHFPLVWSRIKVAA